jgi:hypothetical protein
MSRLDQIVAPALLGAALLFVGGFWLRDVFDTSCVATRANHDRRMQQSDRTLSGLSALTPKDQCFFYRERVALFAEQVKPGTRCIHPGCPAERMRIEAEARLYGDLAQRCSA